MDNKFMLLALKEAKKAYNINEVPVGAVIVKNGVVLAKSHNLKVKTNKIINHAEIRSIIKATSLNKDWRLSDCDMYVTLEPCPMCAGAIVQSRIKKLYIGTSSNDENNKTILNSILNNNNFCHHVEIEYLNNDDCSKIISDFFSCKR